MDAMTHSMMQAAAALEWAASGLIAAVVIVLWMVIGYITALTRSIDSRINTVALPNEPPSQGQVWSRVAEGLRDNSQLHLPRH